PAPKGAPPAVRPQVQVVPLAEPKDTERRTTDASIGASPREVYAEDWWVHSRPAFELHGYLRVRAELFHGFALGRIDPPDAALWPQPLDNSYVSTDGQAVAIKQCGDSKVANCEDKSQAGANMRFRVNPELHISDNLRILSQIDLLDNLVLGSTPGGFVNNNLVAPNAFEAYRGRNNPYVPIGAVATTQVEPIAGTNSFKNSVAVKRAWGEYATPLGQLRFGRMPSHWGLGMLENSGDGYDSDWQSTVDRIMFTTGIKSLDLYASGAWDFPNDGATSATYESVVGGQPYDLAQLDDVNQYVAMVARKRSPELAKLDLARGDAVINGGVYFAYRDQVLAPGAASETTALPYSPTAASPLVRRGLRLYTPDLWFQLLYKKFRFEAEGTMVAGNIDNPGNSESATVRQFGIAAQTELKAIENRLRLQFGFGWASGDSGIVPDTQATNTLVPSRTGGTSGLGKRVAGNRAYSEFRFHPDYRIDLILNRNILGRVQGEYYFRPSVEYDFSRNAEGQKLGGGAALIWTRASEFMQTPGHARDLGIELDFTVYYQSKDGSLNDNPNKMGGFFTMAQYGVLFPLAGLNYLPLPTGLPETSTAHTIRWFMGVLY
ncbi:MAG TPA: TIGR04551 family protein, partial [Polyangiaceae bacterium]|nr:TIGR04551 family protein [Polyangiaceae bacterium]